METDNIKCSSNDIGIYAVKHITKPEVVRRLKEIGTHQQQDPRISAVSYTHLDVYKRQIVHSLSKFRSYILGAKLTIITDNKALVILLKCKLLGARLTRWILAIPVSYTHLDVYKRQGRSSPNRGFTRKEAPVLPKFENFFWRRSQLPGIGTSSDQNLR